MLCNVVIIFHRCRVHTPTIHASSHVDHQKRAACFSVSVQAWGSVPKVMLLCLKALQVARATCML